MAAAATERQSLLAPVSVARLSTHVQEVRADMWEITIVGSRTAESGDGTHAGVSSNIAPRVWRCARGGQNQLWFRPRTGQSNVTLVSARVSTKTTSRVTVGAHTAGTKVT